MFPDSKTPTERQRKELCRMIYNALLEIRILGWQGKSEQAAAVADAFHELPLLLWSNNFSMDFFQKFLESYEQEYPDGWGKSYLKKLDEIKSLD